MLHEYELLDFGNERRWERFGSWVLERPAPGVRETPQAMPKVDATFHRSGDRQQWRQKNKPPERWSTQVGGTTFELALSPVGQVGVFPEQRANWRWIAERIEGRKEVRVLNLFAYTGGSTIAAARAGAQVTHVDAAKNVVARARRNAAANGLGDAPIRWITEDATKFCQREVRRKASYDAIILDPPSFGRGPKGERWEFASDLPKLLGMLRQLLSDRPKLLLLSAHTTGWSPVDLSALLTESIFGTCAQSCEAGALTISTADDRHMPAGCYARWSN